MSVNAAGLGDGLLELDARQAITLYQVGKMIAASHDLDAMLEAIVEATHQLSAAEATALALIDADGRLVTRVSRGTLHARLGQALDTEHGVTARAVRDGRPILVPDLEDEPGGVQLDPDGRYGVRTFLAVPLIWRSDTLGVLTVGFSAPHMLAARDVVLVSALAEQAAAAVRRTRDDDRIRQQLIQNEKLTAIGQLVQGLAHEMNTPLSVVMTNLSVLSQHAQNLIVVAAAAQQALPELVADARTAPMAVQLQTAIRGADLEYTLEDLPELLTDSTVAVRRVAELIRSMANFARRDTGGPSPVAIEDVLEAALTLASNPLKQSGKTIREFAPTPPVLGLTSELTELFLHLLINAAQALEERTGSVTVTTLLDAGEVVISIHDTGRGISAENLPRVFDPFFTTRPVGGGTGMGLAVSYGIVARHRGSITIDSQPGLGTVVRVRLPVAE